MSTATVIISGATPITINGSGSGPYILTDRGLGRPAVVARTAYADNSPHVHGSLLTQAAKEQANLPLEVLVQASSAAQLRQCIDDLDDALWQFSYTVTVTVDEQTTVWTAGPASWGVVDGVTLHGRAAQFVEVLAITIPVYPIPVEV